MTAIPSLYVSSVRIENFRGVVECQVDLEPDLTVLVGQNNVGKSRIMRALALSLGHVPASQDDLTVGTPEGAVIDVYEDGDDLLEFMKKHKGAMGRLLFDELVERYPWNTSADEWPEPLRQLVARLDQMLPPGGTTCETPNDLTS